MSAALKPLTLAEFLEWEDEQEERFEFDGIQPVAMTGALMPHMRVVTRLIGALLPQMRGGCIPVSHDLRIVTTRSARYPDLTVVCGTDPDRPEPVVVFEVLSRSTRPTDLRVKPHEYALVASILACVTLDQAVPEATILRRATGWAPEEMEGPDAVMDLPEVGATLRLGDLYAV